MKKIGILDPEGKQLNPLTGEKYSTSYRYWLEKTNWDKFPMYTNVKPSSIIKDIKDYQVIILEAGTGNGKSVLMPKYALHALDYKGKVVITNPKQLPTRENAKFAASLLDVELGKEVGFQHQGSQLDDGGKSKSSLTKLLFSTDGSVVEVLRKNPSGDDYDIVIVDEAHERNLRIDLILLQMKKAMKINPNLKLIVMSATLPGNLFYDYFKEFKIKNYQFPGKPNKPVIDHYLEKPISSKQVPQMCVEVLFKEIIEKKKNGDVLIFANSYPGAKSICQLINNKLKDYREEKAKCYILTAAVTDAELRDLAIDENKYRDEPGGPWNRKIVVGSNQVESSITVDGIVFVIDNGYSLQSKFDFLRMENQLLEERISKSSARQRKGRAGRTKPGECYKMYTEKEENEMARDPVLDIKKMDISGDIFDVFREKEINTLGDIKKLFDEYIEPPEKESIDFSFKLFKDLGLVDSIKMEGKLTEKGEKVLKLNKLTGYNIRMGCSIVASIDYDCHFDVCSILGIINNIKGIETLFIKYNKMFHDKKKYDKKKKQFSSEFGDIFSLRKMYEIFYRKAKKFNIGRLRHLADDNFLDFNVLLKIRRDHLDFFRRSHMLEKDRDTSVKKYDLFTNILLSLLSGYSTNIAKNMGKGFKNYYPKIKTTGVISKDSMVSKNSSYILYIELKNIQGSKSYNICSKLTKNQIDVLKSNYNYDIDFGRTSTRRRKTEGTRRKNIRKALSILKKKRKFARRTKTRGVKRR